MINALSIDLEEYYHPELVRKHITTLDPRITESTCKILSLLNEHNVKATFFILTDVAKNNPTLIKRIYAEGHEIASHGSTHTPLWDLTPEAFDQELKDSRYTITQILGPEVDMKGFRAPTFSLDNKTKFALPILVSNGFTYDTSIFPAKTPLYGVPDAPCKLYKVDENDVTKEKQEGKLIEFPLTVYKKFGISIPISGGFYLRAIPYFLLKRLLKATNKKGHPFVIYFHPWEICKETPRLNNLGTINKLITYYGISNALQKIDRLLNDFDFAPMNEIILNHIRFL